MPPPLDERRVLHEDRDADRHRRLDAGHPDMPGRRRQLAERGHALEVPGQVAFLV
jgi:hypothetical protein